MIIVDGNALKTSAMIVHKVYRVLIKGTRTVLSVNNKHPTHRSRNVYEVKAISCVPVCNFTVTKVNK